MEGQKMVAILEKMAQEFQWRRLIKSTALVRRLINSERVNMLDFAAIIEAQKVLEAKNAKLKQMNDEAA